MGTSKLGIGRRRRCSSCATRTCFDRKFGLFGLLLLLQAMAPSRWNTAQADLPGNSQDSDNDALPSSLYPAVSPQPSAAEDILTPNDPPVDSGRKKKIKSNIHPSNRKTATEDKREDDTVTDRLLDAVPSVEPNGKNDDSSTSNTKSESPSIPSTSKDEPLLPSALPSKILKQQPTKEKLQQVPMSHDNDKRNNTRHDSNGANSLRKDNGDATSSSSGDHFRISKEQKQQEDDFLNWCRNALGIETILEIQTFEYDDFMKALPEEDWDDGDEGGTVPAVDLFPKLHVRGLAASRDIAIGETVIRIPLKALLSVTTTIDQDPVLSQVMGPTARKAHGWIIHDIDDHGSNDVTPSASSAQDNNQKIDANDRMQDDDAAFLIEMPLLAMALLHHKRLGSASPLEHYVKMLEQSPVDAFPFLWPKEKLRAEVSEGIRTVARGIQQEMEEMYSTVVEVLIAQHPQLFGKNNSTKITPSSSTGETWANESKSNEGSDEDSAGEDWFFDYEHFQWAFAMVNSRHFHLPIPDLFVSDLKATTAGAESRELADKVKATNHEETNFMENNEEQDAGGLPPASMPTDNWIQEHEGEIDESSAEENNNNNSSSSKPTKLASSITNSNAARHSFLAPVADLLNFGKACTKVHYNQDEQTFEIQASCDLKKGEEVTFFYSDECDHVMVGVYGFMHPLVSACPSAEDYRQKAEDYKVKAANLEERLFQAYEDLDLAEDELRHLYEILSDCDCCHHEKPKPRMRNTDDHPGASSSIHFRGASRLFTAPSGDIADSKDEAPASSTTEQVHGVRRSRSWSGRMMMSRKSEF